MVTVQTSVTLQVAGGELVVHRPDRNTSWAIAMFRRSQFLSPAFLQTAELSPKLYLGKTFVTPDDVVTFIRRLLAA